MPEGYASLTEAIKDAEARLEQVTSELQACEAKLLETRQVDAADAQFSRERVSPPGDRQVSLRLDGLLADFDALRSKFQTCRQARELPEHRGTLATLAASVATFHQELIAAAKAA
ncbi:hypothetical protein AWV80_28300 [Cupriavidus sp. UYMU48A]|nr:hypothetical protein AWV80_28300 [Cupriavidus sp. UYMU48A]